MAVFREAKPRHNPDILLGTDMNLGIGTSKPSATLDWTNRDLTVSGNVVANDFISTSNLSNNTTYFNAAEISNLHE